MSAFSCICDVIKLKEKRGNFASTPHTEMTFNIKVDELHWPFEDDEKKNKTDCNYVYIAKIYKFRF